MHQKLGYAMCMCAYHIFMCICINVYKCVAYQSSKNNLYLYAAYVCMTEPTTNRIRSRAACRWSTLGPRRRCWSFSGSPSESGSPSPPTSRLKALGSACLPCWTYPDLFCPQPCCQSLPLQHQTRIYCPPSPLQLHFCSPVSWR